MKALEKIAEKYSKIEHNNENYHIGGGLDSVKFASRRHEDAISDKGKLTLGKANQMFAKATGLTVAEVREIIEYAVPNMEWHHAGKLPKKYGGGMKKTYFLNSDEIVMIAKNWEDLVQKLEIQIEEERKAKENAKSRKERQFEFLQANATRFERVTVSGLPRFYYETNQEMNGKYGWFVSYGKNYNLQTYYSGWEFESQEKLNEFYNI